MSDLTRIEEPLIAMKESLHREMRSGFASLDARFDAQAARLDRQGGLIQTGARWTQRQNEWSEKVDGMLDGILKRLEKLEGRS